MCSDIRIYHDLLYLEIRGIYLHIRKCCEQDDEGEGNTERKKYTSCSDNAHKLDKHADYNSEERQKIALKSEQGEDKRVLQDLKYGQIERNHLNVDVISHCEIKQEQYDVRPEHCAGEEVATALHKHTVYVPEQYEVNSNVYHTEGECLLPVSLNSIPEVRPYEYGVALCNITQYVCSTYVNNTEGEKRKRCKSVQHVRSCCGTVDNRLNALLRKESH